jgi:hypothetical protein
VITSSLIGDYLHISLFAFEEEDDKVLILDAVNDWCEKNSIPKIIVATKKPENFDGFGFEKKEVVLLKQI